MARFLVTQLAALCAVWSFFYISHTFERHSLTERPRLSLLLVLLLSGANCFIVSCLTKWLPGADGRFSHPRHRQNKPLLDHDAAEHDNGLGAQEPRRPRKLSLPVLVLCIVLRMEIFHRVAYQQQCSTPGIESFLCVLLFIHEVYSCRRELAGPPPEDLDDPWRSVFDDIYEWFSGPRVIMGFSVVGLLCCSAATYFSVGHFTRSTYVCFSPIESWRSVLFLQCVGLVLDAVILVLLWRMLAWSRTTKLRLRTMGTVLVLSALSTGLVWVGSRLFAGSSSLHSGFGFLYSIDILVDSFAVATLLVSAAFWMCETSPFKPSCIITFLVGTWSASNNVFRLGDWLHPSRPAALIPLWFIAVGMIIFMYTHPIRYVVFFRRVIVAFLLVVLLITASIYSLKWPPGEFKIRHPVNDLIYRARTKHEHWVQEASISQSLPVALRLYKERHDGRNPPPKFADWYEFAKNTVIVDEFGQIDRDLGPFRKLSPENLRKRAAVMAAHPAAQSITIKAGEVSHSGGEGGSKELEDLANIIKKFSKHLPDMILPINLSPTPQILPTWEEVNRKSHADLSAVMNLISKRDMASHNETSGAVNTREGPAASSEPTWAYTSAAAYLQMQVEACSPGSRTRTNPHWNIGEFCSDCVRRHSKGQLLTVWDRSLEFCAQPDLKYLHGFTLTNPSSPPVRELLPLFSGSKTEPFQDILLPLPRHINGKSDIAWNFGRRYDTLFGRSEAGEHAISDEAIRGSHKYRLLHLVNAPNPADEVTMILPVPGGENEKVAKFRHEKVPAINAASVLPFSLGVGNYSTCLGNNCELLKLAYGVRDEVQEPLEYRYILVLDEDNGPPLQFLRTVRSLSVPFVSTIFRTWYTERLTPWLHFVPIDPRYQALHTVFAYFTGTEDRGAINGRDTKLGGRPQDAEWIGQQGQKWAEQAIGEKDVEVYLFRLLLEWGRLVDSQRDKIGSWQDDKGDILSDDWTRDQTDAP